MVLKPHFGVDSSKKEVYTFFGISSHDRTPEPKKGIKSIVPQNPG